LGRYAPSGRRTKRTEERLATAGYEKLSTFIRQGFCQRIAGTARPFFISNHRLYAYLYPASDDRLIPKSYNYYNREKGG
jgi:hypothetical protein